MPYPHFPTGDFDHLRFEGFCTNALPAAVFDARDVLPSRKTLLAALAARGLVTFDLLVLAIF